MTSYHNIGLIYKGGDNLKTQTILLGIIALVIIGGVVYFATQQQTLAPAPQTSQANPTPTGQIGGGPAEITPASEIKSFEVSGKPFEFDPKEIRVKQGDTVKITFNNTQGFHNWTLDQYNVQTKQIQAGQSDSIQFVADRAGTFEYYCSVGNHRAMGMVGKLVVEE